MHKWRLQKQIKMHKYPLQYTAHFAICNVKVQQKIYLFKKKKRKEL